MTATRYDAFLSYSHRADDQLAPTLQRGLQLLGKPWNRRRALEVFRDRTGLSISPHLWGSIVEALDSAQWFVLLASPDSARSEWVGREIEHWLSRSPDAADRLLPVVTDGTFVWDDDLGDLSLDSTAVHPALRNVFSEEPLYLDLTWLRDADVDLSNPRFRDAVAELAAPIHGVTKDELVSEDIRQHRRAVRLRRSAMTALVVLTVGAIAASAIALAQRQTAEDRRVEAEDARATAEERRLEAEEARTIAEERRVEAEEARAVAEERRVEAETNAYLARSRELAAEALGQMSDNPQVAAALAVEALVPDGAVVSDDEAARSGPYSTDEARAAVGVTARRLVGDVLQPAPPIAAASRDVRAIEVNHRTGRIALALPSSIAVVDGVADTDPVTHTTPRGVNEMVFSRDGGTLAYRVGDQWWAWSIDDDVTTTMRPVGGLPADTPGAAGTRVLGVPAVAFPTADGTWQVQEVGSPRPLLQGLTRQPLVVTDGGTVVTMADDETLVAERPDGTVARSSGPVWKVLDVHGEELLLAPLSDELIPVDGRVDVWSTDADDPFATRMLAGGPTGSLVGSFSPDGSHVLAHTDGSGDAAVSTTIGAFTSEATVWNVSSGAQQASVGYVQMVPGSAWLDPTSFAVLRFGQDVATYRLPGTDFGPATSAVGFASRAGTVVRAVTAVDGTTFVVDLSDGERRRVRHATIPFDPMASSFREIVVDGEGRHVFLDRHVVDLDTGGSVELVPAGDQFEHLRDAIFLPDGRSIAVTDDNGIALYDITDGALVDRIPLDGLEGGAMAMQPDGQALAAMAWSRGEYRCAACGVRIVSLDSGAIRSVEDTTAVDHLVMSDDLLITGEEGTVTIWDISGPQIRPVHRWSTSFLSIDSLSLSPDGRRLLVAGTAPGGTTSTGFAAELYDLDRRISIERIDGLPMFQRLVPEDARYTPAGHIALSGPQGVALLPDLIPSISCSVVSDAALETVESLTGSAAVCRGLRP